MCSDGLTDMAVMRKLPPYWPIASPRRAAEELVHLALQMAGTDNVSVLLLEVKA